MLKLTSPTLTPDADTILILEDAYVDQEDPDTNKDSSSDMQIRKDDAGGTAKEVYLKFNIADAADAVAGKATLRLYIAQHSSGTQRDNFFAELFAVEDHSWTETTITWNNKPAAGEKLLEENVTWFNAGKDTLWSSVDLTHYFNDAVAAGMDTISLTIRGKEDTPGDRLWMAESNWKPFATQLILDYTVEPPERSCSVVEDAHVEQENPDANFGGEADQHLINDDTNNKSKWVYQKFDISDAYEDVISATLKLYARIHSSATDITAFNFAVYPVNSNEWTENGITWNNKPGAGGTMFFQATANPDGGYFNLSSTEFTDFVNAAIEAGKDYVSVAIKGLDETPGNRAWISGRTYKAPEVILNYEKQTSQPVFSPEPGDFIAGVSVEISTLTSGATLYYTTDGTDPDDTSAEYTEAIVLTDTTTLKAVAYAPDLKPSPMAIGTYFITPVGLPQFSPSPVPKYQPPVEVTITAEPQDAVIRYSDDGSDPTTLYSEPIILDQTTTLKAQAFSADFTYSTDVAEVTYTVIPPTGTAGTGPGGVGYQDLSRAGQPELSMWLKADGISGATDGSEITEWPDASGNENDGYNTWVDGGDNGIPNTGESQKRPPVYREGMLNGLPVLEFGSTAEERGSIVVDDADNLDGGEGISLFMVSRRNEMYGDFAALIQKRDISAPGDDQEAYVFEMNGGSNPNEMQWVIARDLFVQNDSIIDDERYYLFNVGLNGDHGLGYFITNGFLDNTAAYGRPVQATHAPVIIGGFQAMNIAEVVAFNSTVNMAQTLIVHEYLAAKYGLHLIGAQGVMNMYDHDTYTSDLIGVGRAGDLAESAEEEHLHATGGALELKADGFAAAGDFVLAAHNGADISEDANKVWSRMWYVKTAGDGGNVDMVFDFTKAGLTLGSAEGYMLSHRATSEDDWADLGITPVMDGEKLVFSVSDIADGYYAVGQALPGTVSTGPEELAGGFSLYPNPAQDRVNLIYSSDRANMVTITVYDFTGRVAHSGVVMNATGTLETTIDLSGFEKGMYMIEVKDGDTRTQKTLVVQ
ncbi:MAG: DNRLRE domain-containing protein [Bacteroidales bacterium]